MRFAALLPALALTRGLRRTDLSNINVNNGEDTGATVGAETEQAVGIWFPIHDGDQLYYYNPVKGLSAWKLPAGAVTAAVQASNDTAIIGSTIVPLDKRKSCVPHCAWNCTQPVCEQNCRPLCPVPQCETRCPKLGSGAFQGCKVNCGEPNCAMFCPETDICPNGTKVMGCPKCSTRCDKPKCVLDCANADTGCKTVCPEPTCQWDCKKPTACPKPDCRMVCEKPPDCLGGKLAVPVPMPDGWEKKGDGKAKKLEAKWQTGNWGACSTRCGEGTRVRSVTCTTGVAEDCSAHHKPEEMQACEAHDGCQWRTGEWGECSGHCGPGKRKREVTCDGPTCHDEKPKEEEDCMSKPESCLACKVTIWGGKNFGGWEHTFGVGEYSSAELEYRGVKCDDISSLEVFGDFCEMKAYEYGDFNHAHGGWEVTFKHGKYDAAAIESAGAKNNDISSFKVYRTGQPDFQAGSAKDFADSARNAASNITSGVPDVPDARNLPGMNGTMPGANGTNPFGTPKIGNLPSPFGRSGAGAVSAVVATAMVLGMFA
mmetsp:Transcript_12349/g.29382  ORF Transcript_12349/g.29382 Transcript_12349/m.29382 type:complete len:541 (+) Transcript_12349:2-1624(+)